MGFAGGSTGSADRKRASRRTSMFVAGIPFSLPATIARKDDWGMATLIADTACIDARARIADDVEIGPYCVIGRDVTIGRGTRLIAHVFLEGITSIGEDNTIYPFVSIGTEPQDLSFRGN